MANKNRQATTRRDHSDSFDFGPNKKSPLPDTFRKRVFLLVELHAPKSSERSGVVWNNRSGRQKNHGSSSTVHRGPQTVCWSGMSHQHSPCLFGAGIASYYLDWISTNKPASGYVPAAVFFLSQLRQLGVSEATNAHSSKKGVER